MKSFVKKHDTSKANITDNSFLSTIHTAIVADRRIVLFKRTRKYNKETNTVVERESAKMTFVPECIYCNDDEFYLIGYNCKKKKIQRIPLVDILSVRLSNEHSKSTNYGGVDFHKIGHLADSGAEIFKSL